MHPILFKRDRFLLYLLAWVPIAGILSALVVKSGTLTWEESLILTIPLALLYSFLCLASFYLCRAFPLRNTGYARLFAIYVVASLLSSGLWIMAARGWSTFLGQSSSFPELTGGNENIVHLFFLNGVLLFILTVFMHYLVIAVDDSRLKEQLALQQSVFAREAELRALRAQIHPHFLFNSLNSISALTTADPGAARNMSIRLAEFLRKTLTFGAFDHIALSREIDLVKDYLAIEKTRFGARLIVETEISESARQCLLPPLILQPLVENAVNHGIGPLPEGGRIIIRADIKKENLVISIQNPVDPGYRSPNKGGVGVENVRKRLSALHGPGRWLNIEKPYGEFVAEISIPVRVENNE